MKFTADQMRSDKEVSVNKHVKEIIELIEADLKGYDSEKSNSGCIKVDISMKSLKNSEEIIKRIIEEVSEFGFSITHTPYKYEEYNGGINFSTTPECFEIKW